MAGSIIGALRTMSKCCVNHTRIIFYALVFFVTTTPSAHSIPMLIEAFIYPTEMITTVGFIIIGVASASAAYTILRWLISDENSTSKSTKKSKKIKRKCCYHLCMATMTLCVYIIVPCSVYGFLWFYLLLLRLRLDFTN